MKDRSPDKELADALRELDRARGRKFFVRNGHVFFGREPHSGDGLDYISAMASTMIVGDARDARALASNLNATIKPARDAEIACAEKRVADARRVVLGLFDEEGNLLVRP